MEASSLTLRIQTEGMNEAQKGMEGLTNTAGMLESAVTKLAAAWASLKVAEHIAEMTQLAARYETLGVVMGVMGNNAGYTSQEMVKFQGSLEKTGISMIAARQSLNMMAAAQLDLSKASALGRVAQDAAVIANINSSEAFERLVQGIQTGQAIILHHMGIMVNFEEGYRRLAPTLGKTASQLSETEKASLRLQMVMEEGEKRSGTYEAAMGTVGKQALSMERYIQNLEVAFGNTFKPAYEVIINGLTNALKSAYEWIKKNQTSIDDLGNSMAVVVKQGAEFTKMLGDLGGGSDGASNSVSFLTRLFQGIGFLMAGATDILRTFAGEFIGFIGDMVKKIGWAADKLTTLFGMAGKGGISRAGDSMSNWGNGITAGMMGPNGGALTAWYDDVFGDKASKSGGRTPSQEAAAIAQGVADRKRIAEEAAARLVATSSSVKVKSYGVSDNQDSQLDLLGVDKWRSDIVDTTVNTEKLIATNLRLQKSTKDLKLVEVTTWGIISKTIEDSSHMATQELAAWMDNLDGVGRSWKTLGDTVRNVIADMLRQMERAILQQQLMGPLMSWASNGSNWSALWGSMTGSTTMGGDGNMGPQPELAPGGATSGTVQSSIVVNVNGSTGETSSASKAKGGTDLGKQIEAAVTAVIIKNQRQGGLLARTA